MITNRNKEEDDKETKNRENISKNPTENPTKGNKDENSSKQKQNEIIPEEGSILDRTRNKDKSSNKSKDKDRNKHEDLEQNTEKQHHIV